MSAAGEVSFAIGPSGCGYEYFHVVVGGESIGSVRAYWAGRPKVFDWDMEVARACGATYGKDTAQKECALEIAGLIKDAGDKRAVQDFIRSRIERERR